MRLDDMKPSFTSLSYKEQIELIKSIRNSRLINKPMRATNKERAKAKESVMNAINEMTPEQAAKLLAELKKENQ